MRDISHYSHVVRQIAAIHKALERRAERSLSRDHEQQVFPPTPQGCSLHSLHEQVEPLAGSDPADREDDPGTCYRKSDLRTGFCGRDPPKFVEIHAVGDHADLFLCGPQTDGDVPQRA
jgi:hypothetical protein